MIRPLRLAAAIGRAAFTLAALPFRILTTLAVAVLVWDALTGWTR